VAENDLQTKLEDEFSKYASDSLVFASKASALHTSIKGWVDTGNKALNAVLGHPTLGIPLGRLVELYGGESHGKTALGYYLLGIVQKLGGLAILADIDGSYDEDWAKSFGIDTEDIIIVQLGDREVSKNKFEAEGMEDLFSKMADIINVLNQETSETPVFILWDDVAGTLTRKELSDAYGEEAIAQAPRVISRGLKKLKSALQQSRITIICINQLRAKIGYGMMGNTTTGGRALKYYASIRAQIRKTGSKTSYITCILRNEKNKVSVPFKDMRLKIYYEDKGVEL
jgi:recombination protein RecA